METSLIEINTDDSEISLMDGSVWTPVDIGDITKISIWYPPQRIKIEESNDKYTMINLDAYEDNKIKVSRVR
jgi:hypothetical protein